MAKESSSKNGSGDEIDLLDLFRRIGNSISIFFTAIWNIFLSSIVFLLRNIATLIFGVLIAVGLSYTMKWLSKPVYRSEITIRSNTIPNADMISYFDRLGFAIKEKNYQRVTENLGISLDDASGLKKLEAFWVIDKNRDNTPDYVDYKHKFNVYDTVNLRMQDRFLVRVSVRDPKLLSALRTGFLNYTSSNESFRLKNEFRLKTTTELLSRLNYDIVQLDSLQKVKYFEETRNLMPETGGQMIFLQERKTQLVYEDIYSLYSRKQLLDQEIDLYDDIITILSDFYMPLKRYNGGLHYGIVIIPATIILMILFLIYSSNKKYFRDIMKRY